MQKLSKFKPKTSKRLLKKYSGREKNRAKDYMHKLSTQIARELNEKDCGAILENLRGIKDKVLNGSKNTNRKLLKVECKDFPVHARIQAPLEQPTRKIRQPQRLL